MTKSFKKPKKFEYNLLVIGAGSAGLVSAYLAATLRARVGLIEKHKMGGDCLNTGCVPSKALIRSAKMLSYARRATEFGFKSTRIDFEFSDIMERVQRVIQKIEPHDSVERYSALGVECLAGEAKIVSPWQIELNGKLISTKAIIIASGARPLVPSLPGIDQCDYLTSDTLWSLRELPKRLVVLGGGPIGCELAQCFQRFGSQVTIVEMGAHILPREDEDVAKVISEKFEREGISLITGHQAHSLVFQNGRKMLLAEKEGRSIEIEFDQILLALGRTANTSGFGLEELGIELNPQGTIKADQFLTTNFPNIFVCGDVTGPYQFTHVAAHQAYYACVNSLFRPFLQLIPPPFNKSFKVNYSVIPWATYTDPEVATVGLTEKRAQEQKIPYELTRYHIDDLDRAIADEEDHGLVKVLTKPGTDQILGATIAGYQASNLINEFIAGMKNGFGLNSILGTIHIYPTMAEANKYLAGNWKKQRKPEFALTFLEKFHRWRRS